MKIASDEMMVLELLNVAKSLSGVGNEGIGVTASFLGEHFDNILEGKHMRFEWSVGNINGYKLTEMPRPGKKRLRVERGHFSSKASRIWGSQLNMYNVSDVVNENMTFDQVSKEVNERVEELIASGEDIEDKGGDLWSRWQEYVDYLEVDPTDTTPMTVEGKDFTINVSWNKFEVYGHNVHGQNDDPLYSGYKQASLLDARKLYKILKIEQNVLRNIGYNQLGTWFSRNGINISTL